MRPIVPVIRFPSTTTKTNHPVCPSGPVSVPHNAASSMPHEATGDLRAGLRPASPRLARRSPFLTWAGVLFGVLVAESAINERVRAGGPVAQGLVTYAGTAAFFWWTMHFLLAGRVPWRRLTAAILTALLWIGLEVFSSVYFSPAIISDSRLYGTIGVVFTLLTWFIAIGAVIVLGAVAGATWDQRKGRSGSATTGSSGQGHDGSLPPAHASRELTP